MAKITMFLSEIDGIRLKHMHATNETNKWFHFNHIVKMWIQFE